VHDTRFLRTFYAVCTAGGFARAAARLNCTQPAVTYQVRAPERDLGAQLFDRGGRRAVLTPAGRRLLEFCRRYFAEYAELSEGIAHGGAARADPLRIAAVSGFGRYVLFPVLTSLLARRVSAAGEGDFDAAQTGAPRPHVDLRFRTAHEVLRQVEDGDVELGVVYLPKVSNYLAFRPVYDEELVLIAAPGMLRAEQARGDLARLDGYRSLPFVTYLEGDYVFGRWFDAMFGAQPTATTSVHHFDELEEVVAMVGLGYGASVVPLDAAKPAIARRAVRVVRPVRGRRCINQVFAVTRAGAFIRREVDELLDALCGRAPGAPAPAGGPIASRRAPPPRPAGRRATRRAGARGSPPGSG